MSARYHYRRQLSVERLESRTLLAVVSFQDGVNPDSSYLGTRDTHLSQNSPNMKYGSAASLNVDGDEPAGSGNDCAALLNPTYSPAWRDELKNIA